MGWFLKLISSAAILLLAFKMCAIPREEALATTTEQVNLASITRYLNDRSPDIVLVGSSLSYRLRTGYFRSAKVDNLAVTGGSLTTGLQIIANSSTTPRLVIIETNILARPPDTDLLKAYRYLPIFGRPIRFSVREYENWRHRPPSREQINQKFDRVLAIPPAAIRNQAQIAQGIADSYTGYPTQAVEATIIELKRLTAVLNARGIKTILFEVPQPTELDSAPFVAKTRERIKAEFPDPDDWLAIKINYSDLRWPDGAHLNERSAILVSRAIEAATTTLLSKK